MIALRFVFPEHGDYEGLYFAFGFVVVYSTSRTLGSAYGYSALKIGLVLLSYGLGLLSTLLLLHSTHVLVRQRRW